MEYTTKLQSLLTSLAPDGLCVAFSGGVDSAVVLKAAVLTGGRVRAVTLVTPFVTAAETGEAEQLAREIGAEHDLIRMGMMPDAVLANPPDRCYHCKLAIFRGIGDYAAAHALGWVLDGTHADDLTVYRPGLRAIKELGVRSPLAELGFHKGDVRAAAAALGITAAEKPPAPCLATRIPYGVAIDLAVLPRLGAVEEAVKSLGVKIVRARYHGDTIRLEVPPADFIRVLEAREALLGEVRRAGFDRLTLDLAGYTSGTFDRKRPPAEK